MTKQNQQFDKLAETKPIHHTAGMDLFQSIRIDGKSVVKQAQDNTSLVPGNGTLKNNPSIKYFSIFLLLLFVLGSGFFYRIVSGRINFVILGLDAGLERGDLGRTDTIVLCTVLPLKPYIGVLSVPRDLWLSIDQVGENRINTAYFFSEVDQPGSGGQAVVRVIEKNFYVPVKYYIVVRMDGFIDLIDAVGGVEVTLDHAVAGYDPGTYRLTGREALKFVRNRSASDDFSRMAQGQILIRGVIKQLFSLETWFHLPKVIRTASMAISGNIPVWDLPRIGLSVLLLGQDNIDARSVTRDMVQPFVTSQGAQVLLPVWGEILPVTGEMFGSEQPFR